MNIFFLYILIQQFSLMYFKILSTSKVVLFCFCFRLKRRNSHADSFQTFGKIDRKKTRRRCLFKLVDSFLRKGCRWISGLGIRAREAAWWSARVGTGSAARTRPCSSTRSCRPDILAEVRPEEKETNTLWPTSWVKSIQ